VRRRKSRQFPNTLTNASKIARVRLLWLVPMTDRYAGINPDQTGDVSRASPQQILALDNKQRRSAVDLVARYHHPFRDAALGCLNQDDALSRDPSLLHDSGHVFRLVSVGICFQARDRKQACANQCGDTFQNQRCSFHTRTITSAIRLDKSILLLGLALSRNLVWPRFTRRFAASRNAFPILAEEAFPMNYRPG
jgi:hypothetical protein